MYQVVISENERRLADANERLTTAYNADKRQAAEFLVSQIELLKEERRALLEDNDSLNIKMNDLYSELDQQRRDSQVIDFLQGADGPYNDDDERQRRMFKRIQELEDLLVEMKQKSGVQRILELETQVNQLNIEVGRKAQLVEAANAKVEEFGKKETLCLAESEVITFFSELLKEKDDQLSRKNRQLDTMTLTEQQKQGERAKLESLVKERTEAYDDLKSRKVQFTEMIKERELRATQPDQRSKWFAEESELLA